ncbi:MAG TPA: phytochelatin synthase family protein [Rhizomicrobium sp.]|nr:phytochelatin synthase family protein [Rhizomicrobium sp.]
MKWRSEIAALCAVVVAGGAWMFGAFSASPYAHVTSIERSASFRDAALIAEAERTPVARSYLARTFEYQHNPSVCGPTSAADVLHSMGRRDSQTDVMSQAGVTSFFGYVIPGLTLDQEANVLRKTTGDSVTLLRDLDLAAFRGFLARANDPRLRFVINFHRGPMFGRGHGHFSPILAYLANRDLVLVGDVNHDYGIYLVSAGRLFAAMNTIDDVTGKKRGLLMVTLR